MNDRDKMVEAIGEVLNHYHGELCAVRFPIAHINVLSNRIADRIAGVREGKYNLLLQDYIMELEHQRKVYANAFWADFSRTIALYDKKIAELKKGILSNVEPSKNCSKHDKWEPVESAKPEPFCVDCKHYDTAVSLLVSCPTCFGGSKWQAVEDAKCPIDIPVKESELPLSYDLNEDAIESAFWAFDTERKKTGAERDAFKHKARSLMRLAIRSNIPADDCDCTKAEGIVEKCINCQSHNYCDHENKIGTCKYFTPQNMKTSKIEPLDTENDVEAWRMTLKINKIIRTINEMKGGR